MLVTPEERQLISDLFDRMRSFGVPVKDREAEVLINQSVRSFSDAPYMLVQSALVQEQALEQAHARIQDLEENLRALEEKQARAPSGTGSFLGGLFGSGQAPAPSSSSGVTSDRSPWRQDPSPAQQPAPPPPPSGGFMHSAMTTAAGVAGGMLVSGAIRDMLGGGAHASPTIARTEEARRDHEALARQDAADDAEADQREQDARDDADADAANDPSSDRDVGGDETEI
jgi:hypothetical protein